MDKADGKALLARLEPWLSVIWMRRTLTVYYKNAERVDLGVVVRMNVDIQSAIEESPKLRSTTIVPVEDRLQRLKRLREAIDVFYLLLLLEPEIFRKERKSTVPIDDIEETLALESGAPFELFVVLSATCYRSTKMLVPRLGAFFIDGLNHETSRDPAYLSVRYELEGRLNARRPGWRACVEASPVSLSFSLYSPSEYNFPKLRALEVDDYMLHLVRFVVLIDMLRHPPKDVELISHLRLVPTKINVKINYMVFTHSMVFAVQGLLSITRGLFECSSIVVDPRVVACSGHDLTAILNALSHNSPKGMSIDTWIMGARSVDEGEYRVRECDLVAQAILRCHAARDINIGGLLNFFREPASRKAIYHAIIEALASGENKFALSFRNNPSVTPQDSLALLEIVEEWRAVNPNPKLHLKALALDVDEPGNTFIDAWISVLDEVEELSLSNHHPDAPSFTAETLDSILTKFSSIKKISIENVGLLSMDIFLHHDQLRLQAIVMRNINLIDRASYFRFTEALGNPATHLAKNLITFEYHQANPVPIQVLHAEATALKSSLYLNRVIQRVTYTVYYQDDDQQRLIEDATQSVQEDHVPAYARGEKPDYEFTRNAALISVLRSSKFNSAQELDSVVVHRILEFASPCVKRKVGVHAFYLADDGEDSEGEDEDEESEDESDGN